MDVSTLSALYAEGKRPRDLAPRVHGACAELGAAFVTLCSLEDLESACEAAERVAADARGPLWGTFYAVKDNVDVRGLPTTAACKAFEYEAAASAAALRALEARGCICVGKANMDQFAAGLNGTRSPYGCPRNALDARVIPGGSSSGSASAVAAGAVTFAIGTDTAGSGRVPAGLQGIVGVKPSVGLISTQGVVPACATLDCLSVFATCVDDGALVAAAMVGVAEAGDWTLRPEARQCLPLEPSAWQAGLDRPVTFAVPADGLLAFGGPRGAEYERDCREAFQRAAGRLCQACETCTLAQLDLQPFCAVARMLYGTSLVSERAAGIAPFLAARGAEVDLSQDERLLPFFRSIIADADGYTAADAYTDLATVRQRRAQCLAAMSAAGVDLIVVPTVMHHYLVEELAAAERAGPPFSYNAQLGTFTNFVNLLGMCAISVPCGLLPARDEGALTMAFGITIIGRAGCDALVWQLARAAEKLLKS